MEMTTMKERVAVLTEVAVPTLECKVGGVAHYVGRLHGEALGSVRRQKE